MKKIISAIVFSACMIQSCAYGSRNGNHPDRVSSDRDYLSDFFHSREPDFQGMITPLPPECIGWYEKFILAASKVFVDPSELYYSLIISNNCPIEKETLESTLN